MKFIIRAQYNEKEKEEAIELIDNIEEILKKKKFKHQKEQETFFTEGRYEKK